MQTTSSPTSTNVYLFGTCLIDSFYPEYGMDAAALLSLCGLNVTVPENQTCCGQPPYNSGFQKQCIETARLTINTFSETDTPLIVPSASCAGMIKHHYPTLFETDSDDYHRAHHLSAKTYELIDFIATRLPYDKQVDHSPIKIALHSSCSAQREMCVGQAWYEILKKLSHVEVIIPDYAEECCGFGGTFAVKSAELSSVMTADKCMHLVATGADLIVSGDSGCLMNIDTHLKKNCIPTPVIHLARFIAQRFGTAYEQSR